MTAIRRLAKPLTALAVLAIAVHAQSPKGWRGEFIDQLNSIERKFTQLADVTPWDRFGWRPAANKDVHSTCELFLHVAGDHYVMAGPLGARRPARVNLRTIERCPDSKEKTVASMHAGFAFMRDAMGATPEADADTEIIMFGARMTKRALMLSIIEHAGEHLGQSIAYARSNGITPPWRLRPIM